MSVYTTVRSIVSLLFACSEKEGRDPVPPLLPTEKEQVDKILNGDEAAWERFMSDVPDEVRTALPPALYSHIACSITDFVFLQNTSPETQQAAVLKFQTSKKRRISVPLQVRVLYFNYSFYYNYTCTSTVIAVPGPVLTWGPAYPQPAHRQPRPPAAPGWQGRQPRPRGSPGAASFDCRMPQAVNDMSQ